MTLSPWTHVCILSQMFPHGKGPSWGPDGMALFPKHPPPHHQPSFLTHQSDQGASLLTPLLWSIPPQDEVQASWRDPQSRSDLGPVNFSSLISYPSSACIFLPATPGCSQFPPPGLCPCCTLCLIPALSPTSQNQISHLKSVAISLLDLPNLPFPPLPL